MIVELALKSVGLVLALALVTALLRRSSAAVRHGVWALGFVGLALLPVLVSGLPTLGVERSERIATPAMTVSPRETSSVEPVEKGTPIPVPLVEKATPPPAAFPWVTILLGAWATGALLILAQTAVSLFQAGSIARRGERLNRVVVRTPEVDVPMTFGLFRPAILLPQASEAWPEERKRTVLLHEEAHILRRDWAWMLFARLVRAFYWPNPLVGWAESRLRAECEMAADDAVLQTGIAASRYAEDLVEIAAEVRSGRRVGYALSIVERATLKSRVREILDRAKSRRPLTLRVAALTLVIGAAGVLPFAAARFVQGVPTVTNGNYDLGNGRQLSLVAITEIDGETVRSWDIHGALLPEPILVTPAMKRTFDTMQGAGGPAFGTVRRYVTFRNSWDGDQLIGIGLKSPNESYYAASDDGYNAAGFYTPGPDLGGGYLHTYRIDFPAGSNGKLYLSAHREDWTVRAVQPYANGRPGKSNLTDFDATILGDSARIRVPSSLAGQQIAVRIFSRDGNDSGSFLLDDAKGPYQTLPIPTKTQDIAKVQLESRPVARFAFGDIPLQPDPKAVYQTPKLDVPGLLRAENGVVRLPDGSSLTLQAITGGPGRPKSFWTAEGKALEGFRWQAYTPIQPSFSKRWRPVAVQFERKPDSPFASQNFYDESGMPLPTSGSYTIHNGDGMFEVRTFLVHPERQTMSLITSLALDPERTRDKGFFGDGRFSVRKGKAENQLRVTGPVGVFAPGSGEQITISLLDANGKPIQDSYSYFTEDKGSVLCVTPNAPSVSKVKGLAINTRKLQWVEFPDVQLNPR